MCAAISRHIGTLRCCSCAIYALSKAWLLWCLHTDTGRGTWTCEEERFNMRGGCSRWFAGLRGSTCSHTGRPRGWQLCARAVLVTLGPEQVLLLRSCHCSYSLLALHRALWISGETMCHNFCSPSSWKSRTWDFIGNPAICFINSYANARLSLTATQGKSRDDSFFPLRAHYTMVISSGAVFWNICIIIFFFS